MNPWRVARYKRQIQANLSFANLFLIIQIVIFLFMTMAGGSTNLAVLVRFGAKFNSYILVGGEYWRFLTPIFIHIGLEHIVMNSVFLYFLGNQIEETIGHWRFVVVYLLSGMMGNIASFAFSDAISAGASTSLFGLFGAIIYLSRNHGYIRFFRELGMEYKALIIINLVMGFIGSGTDNFGHVGGIIGGYLVTAVLSFRGDRKTSTLQRVLNAVAYLLMAYVLFRLGMSRIY